MRHAHGASLLGLGTKVECMILMAALKRLSLCHYIVISKGSVRLVKKYMVRLVEPCCKMDGSSRIYSIPRARGSAIDALC